MQADQQRIHSHAPSSMMDIHEVMPREAYMRDQQQ